MILNLHITDLSRGGAGVARDTSGRVIFVPYTLPGDEVRVQIIDAHKRFAQAQLLEVMKSSKDRVTPPCAVFGKCGGCQWQHVPYPLQWQTKVSGVQQALARVHARLSEVEAFPAERIWEYRNRIQLRGQFSGNETQLGFFAKGTHDLVTAERCEISRPEINASWAETRSQAANLDRKKPFKVEVEVLNPASPDSAPELRRTWNSAHGASGFRQVNDEQNERLKSWIHSVLSSQVDRVNGTVLYDLFGGSGNLSLQFADSMRLIHCVDVSSPSQAPTGTPRNFQFHNSPASRWIHKQASHVSRSLSTSQSQPGAFAILDPPREGLSDSFEVIASSLEKLGVDRLIAVGCDPDSWAKDIARFQARGWALQRTALFDFFPQTPHIESAGFLTLSDV